MFHYISFSGMVLLVRLRYTLTELKLTQERLILSTIT